MRHEDDGVGPVGLPRDCGDVGGVGDAPVSRGHLHHLESGLAQHPTGILAGSAGRGLISDGVVRHLRQRANVPGQGDAVDRPGGACSGLGQFLGRGALGQEPEQPLDSLPPVLGDGRDRIRSAHAASVAGGREKRRATV